MKILLTLQVLAAMFCFAVALMMLNAPQDSTPVPSMQFDKVQNCDVPCASSLNIELGD